MLQDAKLQMRVVPVSRRRPGTTSAPGLRPYEMP